MPVEETLEAVMIPLLARKLIPYCITTNHTGLTYFMQSIFTLFRTGAVEGPFQAGIPPLRTQKVLYSSGHNMDTNPTRQCPLHE
ncbi:hypothetical protein Ppro_2040 [Pelobacter propionicus DSM 2379]|uniref:Uncharacterized protein n=1 Tax=Pelobacter propionicus (strain DSM 2379 / NBRC 103807 / OttBd1) TaxID=338966 RepID=A1AQM8_PELPD|nr:hypothetical protein Ppro_2040 [Pelobacter propionicus DSM 2379]